MRKRGGLKGRRGVIVKTLHMGVRRLVSSFVKGAEKRASVVGRKVELRNHLSSMCLHPLKFDVKHG